MNIIVLGAGAIGCYVAGRLAAAGERVTLIGRPRTIEPIALNGLTVTDMQGFKAHVLAELASSANAKSIFSERAAPNAVAPKLRIASELKLAYSNVDEFWNTDNIDKPTRVVTVILLCVKGGATSTAAQEIADCYPAGAVIVSLQNGVDNVARIANAAPQMLALAGMVPYNVVIQSPAHVHRATMGQIYIEQAPFTQNVSADISHELVAKFNAAGLKARVSKEMRAVQWGKLLLNVNNPINALSDLPLREQLLNRDFRYVFATLQLEALAAMKNASIEPMQLVAVKPHTMPLLLKLPNWIFTRMAKKMLRMDASARSSMWDDVQLGRITEVDDLCGAVVRLAKQVGTAAPCNAAMCKLIAKHAKGQRLTGRELRKALGI
jgi:2-dehydropantoate 2-reductase